jgi:hypothetical protein
VIVLPPMRGAAAPGVPPAAAVPVIVAVPVVFAPDFAAPGTAAPGAVVVGVAAVLAGAGTRAAGAVVTVRVTRILVGLELPARSTSAALSTPSESTITATIAAIGMRQFGVAARRVRAAAPQRRHHS